MNILICEEESVISDIISNLFQKTGYFINIASNTHDAINTLRSKRIDLLITNVEMADDRLNNLLSVARTTIPAVKIILLSRRYSQAEVQLMDKYDINHLICKPFTFQQLETALHKIEMQNVRNVG